MKFLVSTRFTLNLVESLFRNAITNIMGDVRDRLIDDAKKNGLIITVLNETSISKGNS